MLAGRPAKAIALSISVLVGIGAALALTVGSANAGTGPGASGNTITNALQAQTPFSPGTLDSGQPVDVVVPPNTVLTPGATIFVLECSAPGGVDPTTINSCDGNTGYAGGTISVNADGSIDVINTSTSSGFPYVTYALPDSVTLAEGSSGPKCGLGSANECVLYIGQGGGSDTGLSAPHFFSQAFQVHPDPTDSGTLNPGDGTFPADSAPAITSANHATFNQGTAGTFNVTATGYGPPTFTETGTLPTGVTLKTTFSGTSSTGVLAGTPTQSGTFPITISADNGVGSPASQSFTLTVNGTGTAPAITSANHTTFTEGTAGSFTVTATGSPTPTLVETGTLPTGVSFTPSTGKLAGTPTQSGTFPITFTATNGVGSPASQSFTLTVDSSGTAPVITSANHATFTEGAAGSFTVTATGSPTPTLAETGTLPTGVTFTPSTGKLAGTPTQSGTFPITFTATNGVGSPASQSFTLTVDSSGTAPVITSANHATFTEGAAGTFTVTATGSPTPTLAETGTLPTGVSFTPSTGALAGTPTVSGTFPVTITATNGVGSPASQSFTLTVDAAPVITSANHTAFTEGTAGTFTATATGFPAPTFSETGTLPTGVLFSSAGVLSGTPTQSGTFPITFTATNGVGSPASQSFTLTVSSSGTAPAITSANHTTFTEGTAGSFTVTATGSPTPTLAETGTLPTGVTFTPGTGKLAGTPTQSGTFPITFTATNGVGSPASQSFTLTVDAAPVITSANHATFTEGTAGTFTATATGFPAPTFSETGTLPTGVLFSSAGVLSGTPTQSGTFPITITASNGVGFPVGQSFTLTVSTSGTAPVITSANHATFTEGTAGTFTVMATGSPTPTLGESGTLPTGMTFTPGTGKLAGTPTQSGIFPLTFTATNGVGSPASQSFTLTVNGTGTAPAITSANHATFTEGTAGTFTVMATGSPTPTLGESGTLPTGVTFTPGTGKLAGTPTQSGTFPITFTATNGVGSPASQSFTLTVNGTGTAPAITSANHTTFAEGTAGTFTVMATGSPTPTLGESGTLPTGVTFTPGTGKLAGTPTQSGIFPLTFTATNGGVGSPASQSFTLTVGPSRTGPSITLHRMTSLVGNESVAVTGTGWGADDTVTLSECTSPTFNRSSCDTPSTAMAGASLSALDPDLHAATGERLRARITIVVGIVGSRKHTCGLALSGPCYIVAVGNTGDSASTGPLEFSVPHFTLKHTEDLLGNTVDKVEASGFPIGDAVIAAECDPKVHVPKTTATHCDPETAIEGSASSHGRVAFSPNGIMLLIGSAFADSAHRKCSVGGTCDIVVTDSDNPAIGLELPITFATPSVSLKTTTDVTPNLKDKVNASGFPVGDGVVAQECDQSVHVPKTISSHCDGATAISGTVGGKGSVSFSPGALTLLVGSVYVDSSHHSCVSGGTCKVVVVDSDNSNVAVDVPVSFAP